MITGTPKENVSHQNPKLSCSPYDANEIRRNGRSIR